MANIIKTGNNTKNFSKRKFSPIVIVVALLLVVGVATAGYFIYQAYQNTISEESTDTVPLEFSKDVTDKVHEAYDIEDKTKSIAVIDEAIKNNQYKDSRELAYLYIARSSYQSEEGDNKAALQSALKAVEAAPDDPRYYGAVALYHRYLRDTEKALEYYQKAVDVYDQGLPDGYQGPEREFYAQHLGNKPKGDN